VEEYTFLCIRPDGSIPAIDIQAFPAEADALRRLPLLFREHSSCQKIEVWTRSRRVLEAQRAA
jgi:hypothetical protein